MSVRKRGVNWVGWFCFSAIFTGCLFVDEAEKEKADSSAYDMPSLVFLN
jgi:hypothetical protein